MQEDSDWTHSDRQQVCSVPCGVSICMHVIGKVAAAARSRVIVAADEAPGRLRNT